MTAFRSSPLCALERDLEDYEKALDIAYDAPSFLPEYSPLREQARLLYARLLLDSSIPLPLREKWKLHHLHLETIRRIYFTHHDCAPFPSLEERAVVHHHLRSRLPRTYKDFEMNTRRGGTSYIVLAHYTPEGRDRLIKLAAPPKNERARRHVRRGYNVANEIDILTSLPSPQDHHIMEVVDHFPGLPDALDPLARSAVLVQPFFAYEPLHHVAYLVGLHDQGLEHVFRALFDAVTYLEEHGVYHRDITINNILLAARQDDPWDGLSDVRLIDFSDAVRVDSKRRGAFSSNGSLMVRDPLLDRGRRYDATSEVYALGKVMLFCLTGSLYSASDCRNTDDLTTFLQYEGSSRSWLSFRQGYDELLSSLLNLGTWFSAPRNRRRDDLTQYYPLVKRALSLNSRKRFPSVRAFADAFFEIADSSAHDHSG